jgi:hypothetical protein
MAETRDEYLWESEEMGSEVLLREAIENLKGAEIVAEAIISQREEVSLGIEVSLKLLFKLNPLSFL